MKEGLTSLIVGIFFGAGLTVSGMTQPEKVIRFLDVFGSWDPSLAFVIAGAILTHFGAYRFVKHRSSPFLSDKFHLPGKRSIDRKLIIGSFIFGIGWGLGGYCPGPALTSLITFKSEVLIFVSAMAIGMVVQDLVFGFRKKMPGAAT